MPFMSLKNLREKVDDDYLGLSNVLSQKEVILRPIGFVRTKAVGDEVKVKSRFSEIHIERELTPALEGITGFSHVFVLFWLHQITDNQRKTLKVHPRGRRDLPLVGVFAARTNLRFNPIGLTLCELVSVDGNVLTVRGLDAFDGTPVLDVKPYDSWDCAPNARMPEWWRKLEAEKNLKHT
jgi:tRNA-Thr(GGU) m(6)t(6)A37 methyltransferase TsaA